MKYINKLFIKSFRGLRNLELSQLGDINILVGRNNSGKTSVLEAIGFIENPFELGSIIHVGKKREILNNSSSSFNIFMNMLNNSTKSIKIKGFVNNKDFGLHISGKKVSVVTEGAYSPIVDGFEGRININYGELSKTEEIYLTEKDNNFILNKDSAILPITHITPMDHLLENSPNEVIKKGKKKELIELLSIFDKDIIGLEMVEENKKAVPYIEHKILGLMPISTFGDGLKKVLLLGSSIIIAENGVLLIDEVETAIDTYILVEVFNWFISASLKYSIQVFMTTHSIEVIDAILEGQDNLNNKDVLKDSIRIITLRNDASEEKTRVRNIDGLRALKFREDFEMELR